MSKLGFSQQCHIPIITNKSEEKKKHVHMFYTHVANIQYIF